MNISDSILKDILAGQASAAPTKGSSFTQTALKSFTFGEPSLDEGLGDGLPKGALHEIFAAKGSDFASSVAFALLTAERASENKGSFLWITERKQAARKGYLFPLGLAELGIDPDIIRYAEAPDTIAALRVAADTARSAAMGAIILSLDGNRPKGLDLTATRRLSLFARETGVPFFLLRDSNSPMPSAAWSRWQVTAAASHPLEANAPGQPVFNVNLLRHRGGKEGLSALLEWDRENRKFTAHISSVPAVSRGRKVTERTIAEEQRKRA